MMVNKLVFTRFSFCSTKKKKITAMQRLTLRRNFWDINAFVRRYSIYKKKIHARQWAGTFVASHSRRWNSYYAARSEQHFISGVFIH